MVEHVWEIGEIYQYHQWPDDFAGRKIVAFRNMFDKPETNACEGTEADLKRSMLWSREIATRVKYRDGKYNLLLLELDISFEGNDLKHAKFLDHKGHLFVRIKTMNRFNLKKLSSCG